MSISDIVVVIIAPRALVWEALNSFAPALVRSSSAAIKVFKMVAIPGAVTIDAT